MKKNIIISVAVVLLLIVGSVVVIAGGALTDDQQDWFDSRAEKVEEMVSAGEITEAQADEYLERLEQCILEGECQGEGTGCTVGQDCTSVLGRKGECSGFGSGSESAFCRQYSNDSEENSFNGGCSGFGGSRGCGR